MNSSPLENRQSTSPLRFVPTTVRSDFDMLTTPLSFNMQADVTWNIGTGYFACGDSSGPDGARVFKADMFAENAAKDNVKMIEIKLSQGAKPSHGGILPAAKITETIAEARGLGQVQS